MYIFLNEPVDDSEAVPFSYDAEALFKWTKWFHYKVGEDVKLEQLATK